MPFFLHQWKYKDHEVKAMLENEQNREHVVSLAVEAFGGNLHQFFFCFGSYDGIAISEFPDSEAALACVMTITSHGGLARCETTALFNVEEGMAAMSHANNVMEGDSPYQAPSRTH
ncbi:GYD domain-containing protein [Noviherbaspirillum aridicola]|uniref:GYD domain-containing protein n=1 Tax=Noviherbaspirillum aridicola TaxID=2849687 RepID=A0ABQ4Q0A2_9BURK|nr:GYD domain-containing protein [Noviherbaspirillum aridicola]GIZ50565.1 hypothetical protein NCCP691_05790 [Noviherbaspirillum aridicola]